MTNHLPIGSRQSAVLAAVCLPVLLCFGWLMFQRLAACPKGIQADFAQEWTSARNFWTARPIYLPLQDSFPIYFDPEARTELLVNAHPPVAVLVALPLGLCDYRSAWLIWNITSLALLGASLWLLMRELGLGDAAGFVAVAALLLASNPLAQQVIEGQMNLLLLALLVAAWAADRHERQAWAGSLVGLAAAIKLYPAFLLVYFIARRRWRAAAAGSLSFLAASLLAMWLLGADIFVVYARDVMPAFAHYGDNLANASLAGVWSKVLVGTPGLSGALIAAPSVFGLAKVASGVALAALCGWKAAQSHDAASADAAFAAGVVGMLLASPITWGHSFVQLVIPLLVLWRHAPGPLWRGSVAALAVVLWLVRPGWIWNAIIPGFQAFTLGVAPASYTIPPLYSLTALSYLTYALVALLGMTLLWPTGGAAGDMDRS